MRNGHCSSSQADDAYAAPQVLDLWWVGNDLHATVQVLNTRAGDLVRNVYLSGHIPWRIGCARKIN